MKRLFEKAVCLALVFVFLGGCAAMGENVYYGKDSGAEWYRAMLQDGIMRTGNNLRLKRVIERAQAGEHVTVAAIGGSITEGAGAADYQECYAVRFFRGFAARYGVNKNVHLVNAGVGGTGSTFGLMRYQRDIVDRVKDADEDGLPDLVVIEFAVNDWQEPTKHRCYESLVKTVLEQPNEPAVILLFAVFKTGFNLQDEIRKIGETYDLMMVSVKDAAFSHVGKEWQEKEFFYDEYHPTSMGHAIMADCLLAAVDTAAAKETDAQDIALDVAPVYGVDFMGFRTWPRVRQELLPSAGGRERPAAPDFYLQETADRLAGDQRQPVRRGGDPGGRQGEAHPERRVGQLGAIRGDPALGRQGSRRAYPGDPHGGRQ